MKILVCHFNSDKGRELLSDFRQNGHDAWATDWQSTQDKIRNFIKVNPLNYEAFNLAIRMVNPEEIHNVVSKSYLANIHVLLTAGNARKVVFYFEEPSPFLEEVAQSCSKEFGFAYESK